MVLRLILNHLIFVYDSLMIRSDNKWWDLDIINQYYFSTSHGTCHSVGYETTLLRIRDPTIYMVKDAEFSKKYREIKIEIGDISLSHQDSLWENHGLFVLLCQDLSFCSKVCIFFCINAINKIKYCYLKKKGVFCAYTK